MASRQEEILVKYQAYNVPGKRGFKIISLIKNTL